MMYLEWRLELGKVGIFSSYSRNYLFISIFFCKLWPDVRTDAMKQHDEPEEDVGLHRVEAVLGPRFPGINKKLGEFNFQRHYGAAVKEIKRSGQSITTNLDNEVLREGEIH